MLRATPISCYSIHANSTSLVIRATMDFFPATFNPCLPQVTAECTHSNTLAVTISFVSSIIIAARGAASAASFVDSLATYHTLLFSEGFCNKVTR